MINIKGGTQTWSNSPQHVEARSPDGTPSLGDTLNRVADANYVEAGKKLRAVGKNEMGKDAFMTLLLTQMKNQDPTNPLKSHEMAAQLAQFTALEKLNNINEGIDNLRKENQSEHTFQALGLIGKTVSMDNSKIARMDVTDTHNLRFSLPADCPRANVEIKDASGNVIRKMELKSLKSGQNQIKWNGHTDDDTAAPVGDYTLSIEAFGSNDKKLYVEMKADGVITGVNFTAHGPQLLMGKQVLSLADIKTISEPELSSTPAALVPAPSPALAPARPGPAAVGPATAPPSAQQPAIPASASELPTHKAVVKPETKGNEAKRASLSRGSVNDSALTQGLINRLNKEGVTAGMQKGPS